MVDIGLDVLDATSPAGAVFVANNRAGAKALASILGQKVRPNQKVVLDGRLYQQIVQKLVNQKVTVLNYTSIENW